MQSLKRIIRELPAVQTWLEGVRSRREYEAWQKSGGEGPSPHLVKQRTIREYARRYGCTVLVETGTFRGQMIQAMRGAFERIISIELSPALFKAARRRFRSRPNVELQHGDSMVALPPIVKRLNSPALFWLDGHYSAGDTARGVKDTPIYEELTSILNAGEVGHVVLIDDARCFVGKNDYPALDELRAIVAQQRPDLEMVVRDDIIRIAPRQ
jgi:hypothetical protein